MSGLSATIKSDINLPSPPAVAMRILEAVKNEETSFDELSRIITADPGLASKILRVANSPFYALSTKVDSIQRALTVIGFDALKNIALSFVIATEMKTQAEDNFDFDFFWKRSVTAAVSGDLLASLIGQKSDDIFVTALLQDIGIVIMYLSKPDEYLRVLDQKSASGFSVIDAENKIFSFDHQELGMQVLKHWGLPSSIYNPVSNHHKFNGCTSDDGFKSNILYLSDKLSSIYHGHRCIEKMQEIKDVLLNQYGVDQSQVEKLVDTVAEHSIQIMSYFEIDPGDMKPFSLVLQEANEQLGKATLSYEQLLIELKRSKETAENLARELQKTNEKLMEMAFRDGLTELYNHRYFQELMEKEVSRAHRYQHPFSLIMFDLDHFKKINDQYGHPIGDLVLKKIADTALATVRKSDFVARYGGEEFVIALPETGLKGAVIFAERLRKRVEDLRVDTNGHRISATISLGITTWAPGSTECDWSTIISATDKALYNSKSKGRNTISYVDLNKVP